MHLKRQNIGKFWPVPRKGTKYLALATHNQKESIPLVVVMRDILKLVKNKKELKTVLNEKQILINYKEIREVNYPVCLFDVISLKDAKKNYRANLSKNKKMIFDEISDKDAETKIYKIVGKKILSKGKMQINLMQGKNLISDEKASAGDSVILNLKDNKIVKIIPLEKEKTAFALKGKHAGSSGKIIDIMDRGGKKIAKILADGKRINVWTKNIIVVE